MLCLRLPRIYTVRRFREHAHACARNNQIKRALAAAPNAPGKSMSLFNPVCLQSPALPVVC